MTLRLHQLAITTACTGIMCLAISGCGARSAFDQAVHDDNPGAYSRFLGEYPDSEFSGQAKEKLSQATLREDIARWKEALEQRRLAWEQASPGATSPRTPICEPGLLDQSFSVAWEESSAVIAIRGASASVTTTFKARVRPTDADVSRCQVIYSAPVTFQEDNQILVDASGLGTIQSTVLDGPSSWSANLLLNLPYGPDSFRIAANKQGVASARIWDNRRGENRAFRVEFSDQSTWQHWLSAREKAAKPGMLDTASLDSFLTKEATAKGALSDLREQALFAEAKTRGIQVAWEAFNRAVSEWPQVANSSIRDEARKLHAACMAKDIQANNTLERCELYIRTFPLGADLAAIRSLQNAHYEIIKNGISGCRDASSLELLVSKLPAVMERKQDVDMAIANRNIRLAAFAAAIQPSDKTDIDALEHVLTDWPDVINDQQRKATTNLLAVSLRSHGSSADLFRAWQLTSTRTDLFLGWSKADPNQKLQWETVVRAEQAKVAHEAGTDTTALRKFISEHADSPLIPDVQLRLDDATYADAVKTPSEASFKSYRQAFPKGRHVTESETAQDAAAYLQAQRIDTLAGYNAYLSSYLEGAKRTDARKDVTRKEGDLAWDNEYKAKSGDRSVMERFIAKHATSSRVADAREAIMGMDFASAEKGGAETLLAFAAKVPGSTWAAKASDRLNSIVSEKVVMLESHYWAAKGDRTWVNDMFEDNRDMFVGGEKYNVLVSGTLLNNGSVAIPVRVKTTLRLIKHKMSGIGILASHTQADEPLVNEVTTVVEPGRTASFGGVFTGISGGSQIRVGALHTGSWHEVPADPVKIEVLFQPNAITTADKAKLKEIIDATIAGNIRTTKSPNDRAQAWIETVMGTKLDSTCLKVYIKDSGKSELPVSVTDKTNSSSADVRKASSDGPYRRVDFFVPRGHDVTLDVAGLRFQLKADKRLTHVLLDDGLKTAQPRIIFEE